MERLILARHAHARSNEGRLVNGVPPGEGLSERGVAESRAAAELVAPLCPELGVASRFARAQETLALLAPSTSAIVMPDLDEIGFGVFEGGSLDDYRSWAWTAGPGDPCPGGGESRAAAAARLAAGLGHLRGRAERVVLAVSHSLPIRYVLDAAAGVAPARRVRPAEHAAPHVLDAGAVARAEELLRDWSISPAFRDASNGGY